MDNFQRLQFAVGFSQMDLAALRESEWIKLREDFVEFFGLKWGEPPEELRVPSISFLSASGRSALTAYIDPRTDLVIHCDPLFNLDTNEIAELQPAVFSFFSALIDWDNPLKFHENTTLFAPELAVAYSIFPVPGPGPRRLIPERVTTKIRDGVLLALDHLMTKSVVYVRKCKATETCTRLFVSRDMRKLFCSNRCSSRIRIARRREKLSNEMREAESEKAHQRYEKKVRRETGNENLKVSRQRRSSKTKSSTKQNPLRRK